MATFVRIIGVVVTIKVNLHYLNMNQSNQGKLPVKKTLILAVFRHLGVNTKMFYSTISLVFLI